MTRTGRRRNMIEKKWRISVSIALVGLFCLMGCAGPGPAQSLSNEPDMLSLAEIVMDESDLLALAEGATEQSDLLALAENATEESPLRILIARKVRLFERVLQRLDRAIERGQIAEERREQTLESVRTSLAGNMSEEQKAAVLERVEARIDRAIERGLFAQEHNAEILGRVEEMTARAVEPGSTPQYNKVSRLMRVRRRSWSMSPCR
jgi:hypothetical protein